MTCWPATCLGFAAMQELKNVTYLCRETVNASCLLHKSPDVCVHEILHELEVPELLQKPVHTAPAATGCSPTKRQPGCHSRACSPRWEELHEQLLPWLPSTQLHHLASPEFARHALSCDHVP